MSELDHGCALLHRSRFKYRLRLITIAFEILSVSQSQDFGLRGNLVSITYVST